MQQDHCQRNKFKYFGKPSFSDQKGSKRFWHRGNIQENVQPGFLWRQVGHSRSKRKTKLWFHYFLRRQEIFELNERKNKNGFQSIWVAIALQNDDTALPNNRYQALQGLKHLKNKYFEETQHSAATTSNLWTPWWETDTPRNQLAPPQKENAGIFLITEYTMRTSPTK